MTPKLENSITLQITRDHDKLCILEKYLLTNNLSSNESIISNLIDSIVSRNKIYIKFNLDLLRKNINNSSQFKIIINYVYSYANKFPLTITLEINESNIKYINYINNNQDILPLF